ncbi:efflux transporter outer membrane subunit [Terricaulis sp.]|uniref:efflux transporter outer membrane subunit n=1 Tax=Terricaulis sp. TaxID=2768686 RepID=UPI003783ACB4
MAPIVRFRFRTIVVMGAAFLGACSTMPRERPTAPALAATWQDVPVGANVALTNWWEGFNDPELDRLIGEALAEGPSLQLAAARVREARALSRATIAQYLPELNASGSGQYTRSLEGGDLAPGEREQMLGSYGPQVSWEVPLWGRIEATAVGARAQRRAALADYRGAQVALVADIAQAYVDLRAANASRLALQRSIESADELARILEISARAGITAEADAANARRLAEITRARLPGLVIEARRAENVLAVLRGVAPGNESAELRAAIAQLDAPVPHLDLAEAPGAPADLLRLRPDVAAAEAQALLAAAAVSDARTNLLPRLNLSGSISVTDALIGNPTGAGVTIAQATPLISIPLFDWGARLAAVGQRNAQFDQRLIEYRQTVLSAVAEASNALTSLDQGSRRLVSARAAEQAAERSATGSRAAYQAGIQSLTDRLQSEQQLIDATLSRIDAESQQARAAIATYRAFGGGPAITPRV